MNKKKTVVLGLDGATFKLLKPFAQKGWMPNVARLLADGVHGELESTIPAMTAPSWATFATGKHPGHHGIFDFMLPTDSLGNMKFATSRDLRDTTIYEFLADADITPILVNLPVTWPPKRPDIITITSLLTQGDEWIYPASLKEEFPPFAQYRLTPNESLRLKERKQEYIDDLLRHLEEQMTCVRWLFEHKPWDFFFYLFSHTDWVSHLAYTALEEQHDEAAAAVFKKVDEHIGWFISHLPANTNLVIVSDHGFKSYKKIFYFNKWLEDEGYLRTNTNAAQFHGAATRRAKETDKVRGARKSVDLGSGVFRLLAKVPMLERAAKWTYHHIVKPYLPVNVKVNVGIDFNKTKVCFPKGSYITNAYINKDWVYEDGIVSREEYMALRTEVVEKMRAIRDQQGNPVVKRVFTREEVYGDRAPDQAPDIFFELADYWLVGHFHSGKLFDVNEENKHDIMGMFMAVGPDFIGGGAEIQGLKMQDITPLLLHLNGLPVPVDCDGHVPTQVLKHAGEIKTIDAERPSASVSTIAPQRQSEKAAIANVLKNIKL